MNLWLAQPKSKYILLGLGMLVLGLGVVFAWRSASSTEAAPTPNDATGRSTPASFTPTLTTAASPMPVAASSTPKYSSTPTPTSAPALPLETDTPVPTATEELGWMPGWGPKNDRDVIISNAWRGIVGSQLYDLEGGRSAAADRFDPSNSQGLLYVNLRGYYTPLKAGPVAIAAIEGTRAILTPTDPQAPRLQFVFDFIRRVWVPPDVAPDAPLAPEWVECPNSMTNPRQYYFSCWQGKTAQGIVNLAAGRQTVIVVPQDKGSQWSYESECCHGVLRVNNFDVAGNVYRSELYSTPYNIGYVRIVSVNGSRVTLAAYGDTSLKDAFVFDLATRRWVQPQANAVNTMTLGHQGCFDDYNFGGPRLNDCWSGKVDGSIFNIELGVDSRDPRDQGMLVVSEGADIDPFSSRAGVYPTPLKVGFVSLVLVDKTYLYLQTADKSHTFVFDLKTRQWLTSPVTPTPSMTSSPTATHTLQPPGPPIGSTEAAQQQRDEWQTAVASIPTFTPVPKSLQTPGALWKFERADCGQDGSNRAPVSCWGGVGDGAILSVRTFKATDDTSQGSISVCIGLYPCGLEGTYKSPLKLGPLHIVSIRDNLVNLTSDDGRTTLVFDLQTRQWIPPSTSNTRPLLQGRVLCQEYSIPGIDYFGCWQGLVGGETIQLRVGRESGGKNGPLANGTINCCKGVIEVGAYGTNASGKYGYYTNSYTTTEQTNALYLVSVKGQRVTLASYDPALKGKTWIFDLEKREWIVP